MTDEVETSHPAALMCRLETVEQDLAARQNTLENAARRWYAAQREIGRRKAQALLTSSKASVTEKKAEGDLAAYEVEDSAQEAEYEATKAFVRVLEQRSMILMSLLRAQGRA